jgi:hypothetical protein
VTANSIPKNHMEMCRYKSAEEVGFKRTAGHIIRLIRYAEEEATRK